MSSPAPTNEKDHDVEVEKGTLLNTEVAHSKTTPVLRPAAAEAEKQARHEAEVEMADARSETVGLEEQLPEFEVEEWEKAEEEEEEEEEEEGDYVKLNVD